MGSVNANFLPATTGLSLGNQNQEWNGFFQNLTVGGLLTAPGIGFSAIPFSPTPIFDGSQAGTFEILLQGNVTSSSIINFVAGGIYTFIIIQNVVGGDTFAWPTGFNGGMIIDPTANSSNVQQFVYDGMNAFAVSAGVSM